MKDQFNPLMKDEEVVLEIWTRLYEMSQSYTQIAKEISRDYPRIPYSIRSLRRFISELDKHYREEKKALSDVEIESESERLAKQSQKLSDVQRIERKAWRENVRIENALKSMHSELIRTLKAHNLGKYIEQHTINPPQVYDGPPAIGIVQFSDSHFNELIDLPYNQYNFTIASARAKKLIEEAIREFSMHNTTSVVFAATGDMINSDRRLDEILNAPMNRAKALFLSTEIIAQMILHLNEIWPVSVAFVTGNESRITNDVHWSNYTITDNYDFIIFNMLKEIMPQTENGIHFFSPSDPAEMVINVMNKHILLLHGNQKVLDKQSITQRDIQQIVGKYAASGTQIDYVIFGHIHSSYVSDFFARSGSLSGGNAYSDRALQFMSKATQNIHVVYEDAIHTKRIDLQNVTGEGYNIHDKLAEYNSQAQEKMKGDGVTIHRIVI